LRGKNKMAVSFYRATGEGDFEKIMYGSFSDKVADGHHPDSRSHIMTYDINSVAVIHATKDGDESGRNSLRMVGLRSRFSKAKDEIERRTGFKLRVEGKD